MGCSYENGSLRNRVGKSAVSSCGSVTGCMCCLFNDAVSSVTCEWRIRIWKWSSHNGGTVQANGGTERNHRNITDRFNLAHPEFKYRVVLAFANLAGPSDCTEGRFCCCFLCVVSKSFDIRICASPLVPEYQSVRHLIPEDLSSASLSAPQILQTDHYFRFIFDIKEWAG